MAKHDTVTGQFVPYRPLARERRMARNVQTYSNAGVNFAQAIAICALIGFLWAGLYDTVEGFLNAGGQPQLIMIWNAFCIIMGLSVFVSAVINSAR
jgi:hypothetical protein